MKKKLLIVAILLIALALFTRHYSLIEKNDPLPEDVQAFLNGLTGTAHAAEDEQSYIVNEVLRPHAFLEKGDSGETVKALQEKLYDLGFSNDTADGIFGEQTEGAVSALKDYLKAKRNEVSRRAEEKNAAYRTDVRAAQEIELSGEAAQVQARNQAALKEMRRALEPCAPVASAAAESGSSGTDARYDEGVSRRLWEQLSREDFLAGEETLREGASGYRVTRLQNRLKALNYLLGDADGQLGEGTRLALTAFQKFNDLPQTGVADTKTQQALYARSARAGRQATGYLLKISVDNQRVYAYEWSVLDQAYTRLARTMVCSTGLNATPTPKGTFTNTTPVVRWGYFPKFDCWAQYLYRINGSILFHSVLYDSADESTLRWGSVYKLGSKASHGCVRLSVEDAKWIYNHCPAGTTITVY